MSDLLSMDCLLSNSHIMGGMESDLKLLVNVQSASTGGQRPPINLALVIDRSTSMMEQQKLEYVRTAANYAMQRLTPQDVISVVDFGSDVNVLLPAQAVTDGVALSAALSKLQARGATNIYEAIRIGVQEITKFAGGGRVNRILLLSDGVATEGLTTDAPILQMADQARQAGAAISTLGVGNDYDEVLLNAISEHSGGNHYYIAKPDDVNAIFLEEMNRLEAVVARNLRLRVLGSPGFAISLLNGRYASAKTGDELDVTLNELQKGKSQPVIFGVGIPAQALGEQKLGTVTLEYEDVSVPGTVQTLQSDVTVQVVNDPGLIRDSINREVLRQWEELDAVQAVAQIVADVESGKVDATSAVAAIDKRGQTLIRRGSAQAAGVIEIGKTIARSGGITPEIKKSTIAYKARLQQGQS